MTVECLKIFRMILLMVDCFLIVEWYLNDVACSVDDDGWMCFLLLLFGV